MDVHREYARFSRAELTQALRDPAWAAGLLDALSDVWITGDPAPEEARFFDVDTSWPGIEIVLSRGNVPLDLVNGTKPLPISEEWGYGSPSYLTPDQVAAAAAALAGKPFQTLVAAADPPAPVPGVPSRCAGGETSRQYLTFHGQRLVRFFAAAAAAGDAVVVMLT